MTTQIPGPIGPYVPLRKLGEGGMGVVYCAQDSRDPTRLVALKVISGLDEHGDDTVRRFSREAKILEGLRHPNIVTFYEIGYAQGKSFFAMELLKGTNLRPYIGNPVSEVLPLFIQICQGMEYLAGKLIVHRDLSPDNIFVVDEGRRKMAKILDFGIAKNLAGQDTFHNFTMTGMLLGKPRYWSPEQIGNLQPGEKMDWRSDVYALGVIFYLVLSGDFPFDAETPAEFITKHLFEPPPDLVAPAGNPPIPRGVLSVVMRMLEKDRNLRPQSYGEIIEAFNAELGDVSQTDVYTGEEETVQETSPTLAREMEQTAITGTASREFEPTARTDRRALETTGLTSPTASEEAETFIDSGRLVAMEAPTVLEEKSRAARSSRGMLLAIAAAVVLVVGGGAWILLRPGTKGESADTTLGAGSTSTASGPARPAPPTAVPATTADGTLVLDAMPWGRVLSVINTKTSEAVSIADADQTTPVRLQLPAGSYSIAVVPGGGGEAQHLVVDVLPGQTVPKTVSLGTVDVALKLLN